MRRAVAALLVLGCGPEVVRDRTSYMVEVTFTDRLLREAEPATRAVLQSQCACVDNVWRSATPTITDVSCRVYAEWLVVYTSRWNWHHDMMLFNGGITDTRPPTPPVIPRVSCALPEHREE